LAYESEKEDGRRKVEKIVGRKLRGLALAEQTWNGAGNKNK